MSTRHIVRISPLHTSILLTVIYCLVALIIAISALVISAFRESNGFLSTLSQTDFENILAAILLNVVLVFLVALGVSMLYNFLAKYLGGIEITLDDD